MNANTMAVGATGMRNSIPQVQVIPQIQSPPYLPQFYSSQQQQFMLQNAAMQGEATLNNYNGLFHSLFWIKLKSSIRVKGF